MPNLSHTFSTLGMDRFKHSNAIRDLQMIYETYPIAVFWNSYLELVQTLRDFWIYWASHQGLAQNHPIIF